MPKPLQYVPEDAKLWTDSKGRPIAIAEVTIRTIMRMFLLKPTTQNTTYGPTQFSLGQRRPSQDNAVPVTPGRKQRA